MKSWKERIDEADYSRKGFNQQDLEDAKTWLNCATCKKYINGIERDIGGSPIDWHLTQLGCAFYDAILYNSFGVAREMLTQIKERTIEIGGQYYELSSDSNIQSKRLSSWRRLQSGVSEKFRSLYTRFLKR